MNDFKNVLISYLKTNFIVIITGIILLCIFIGVFLLYSIPLESILYASLLALAFLLIIAIIHFINFYNHHMALTKLKNNIALSDYMLPQSINMIEKDYQELIKEIDKSRTEIINEKNKSYSDMIDYYTIWAHQIKTPIAAMRLILQSNKSETSDELLEQLFKIEEYVEMVLQYLRLENMNSDLMFREYSLDNIIKQSVKKYSKLFIRKKIKLNYDALNCHVLTDEKWIVFAIEQILSNSLKYTNSGEISIYMDEKLPDTLVIEDTGIGIEEEDLPRVFEKGFTGYNGRTDKKSTGIGLYLSKQIIDKLFHTIYIAVATKSPLAALNKFFVAVILVIIGTYCLFTSGSIAVLKALRKNKKYYYQSKHFITVSGLIYRMKQNAAGLANICILSTAVIIMISSTISLYSGIEDVLRTRYPRNVIVRADSISDEQAEEINTLVSKQITDSNINVKNVIQYRNKSLVALQDGSNFTIADFNYYSSGNLSTLILITQDEYNKLENKSISLNSEKR